MHGGASDEPRARRLRVRLLVAPLLGWFVATTVGVALAPALLERSPIALLVLAPLTRHLVLVSPALDAVSFFTLGALGLVLPDPFAYLLGREYGSAAIGWIERRSGGASRWVRWVHAAFRRAAPLVLFVSPGPFVNLLAGASRMRVAVWLPVNLAGTLAILLLTRLSGEALAGPIGALRAFIEANVVALTAASVALVTLGALIRRRRVLGRGEALDGED
jgi:membrane protein DedA with SNARE-associated domain